MTLVDTSSWIEFLRGRESEAGHRVRTLLSRGAAAWCDMTRVELWNGARGRHELKALEELEAELTHFPVNEAVWAQARLLARRCRASGVTAPNPDIVIAACAVLNRLPLEHCDAHFAELMPLAVTL